MPSLGTYVQTYDPAPRFAHQSPIPAMRHPGDPSTTPIYDALYAEYRRAFKALPGDRSGEEDLGFTSFSSLPGRSDGGAGGFGHGEQRRAGGARHAGAPRHGENAYGTGGWHPAGPPHGPGDLVPAVLPPGRRDS
ncbi:hypothetical protein [Streptomyces sp. NPDC050560]|uniref:hypothetical protein n=1 Tax=Streptomyces sp. NPDC050560 TaxID=3365630 RepID=UPI0037B31A77